VCVRVIYRFSRHCRQFWCECCDGCTLLRAMCLSEYGYCTTVRACAVLHYVGVLTDSFTVLRWAWRVLDVPNADHQCELVDSHGARVRRARMLPLLLTCLLVDYVCNTR
jgi:hypothetical protein